MKKILMAVLVGILALSANAAKIAGVTDKFGRDSQKREVRQLFVTIEDSGPSYNLSMIIKVEDSKGNVFYGKTTRNWTWKSRVPKRFIKNGEVVVEGIPGAKIVAWKVIITANGLSVEKSKKPEELKPLEEGKDTAVLPMNIFEIN